MVTADLILELAVVLTVFVVLLAIPRMLAADKESRAALRRQQALHHDVHAHARVPSSRSRHDEHQQQAAPRALGYHGSPVGR